MKIYIILKGGSFLSKRLLNNLIVLMGVMLLVLLIGACSPAEERTDTDSDTTTEETDTTDDSTESSETDEGEGQEGGELIIGLPANPTTLDPTLYEAIYESQVLSSVGSTLVIFNKELDEFIPNLAIDWEISDDLKTYTFQLRDDVYFHPGEHQDGRQMTGDDVKYSLERSLDEAVIDRLIGVESVEVIDDFEIVIHLEEKNAALINMLADIGNMIVPKEEVEGMGEDFARNPIGTGPFMIEDWQADMEIKIVQNENYWGETPHLDSVVYKIISDPNMMTNALRSGDIDIGTEIKGQNREVVEQADDLQLQSVESLSISYLDLNNVDGPTSDPDVRRAIYMATDVDEIVEGANQYGGAEVSYMPLPKISWGYSEELEALKPEYDLEAAKELLADAGYPDGFETEIYINESRVPYATIFQNQMEENLNIDVEINVVEWGAFTETVSSGNAPMSIGSWNGSPDPYFFLNRLYYSGEIGSIGNGKGYNNSEVDELLDEALYETADQDERAELYQEALEIILEETPRIELDMQHITAGVNEKVKGFEVAPNNAIHITSENGTNVWIEE